MWQEVAASVAGSIGGTILDHSLQESSAKRQRRWQEDMSNTAHQREVEDLKLAGLNPILSSHSGASTPSGSGTGMTNTGNIYTDAVSAVEKSRQSDYLKKQTELAEVQKRKEEGNADYAESDAFIKRVEAERLRRTFEKVDNSEAGKMLPYVERGKGWINEVIKNVIGVSASAEDVNKRVNNPKDLYLEDKHQKINSAKEVDVEEIKAAAREAVKEATKNKK